MSSEDYEYVRRGTSNLFVAIEPKGGHREVSVTEHRCKAACPIGVACSSKSTSGNALATPLAEPSSGSSLVKMQTENSELITFRYLRVDVLGLERVGLDRRLFAVRPDAHRTGGPLGTLTELCVK